MAGQATALQRAKIVRDCLLKHGVPEVSIELQVGRPFNGDAWNALKPVSVMSHHIASHPTPAKPTPGLYLVKHGRSDLPGPLCNGTAGVDLVYRIITLGLANHPGVGGPITMKGPVGNYTIPEDNARAYAWGTEFEGGYDNATWDKVYTNKRTGKKMTFREFMGRVNAGLCEAIWLINSHGKKPAAGADLSGYHMEHKTWAPGRKVDRYAYSTVSGRAEVKKYDTKPGLPIVDLSNLVASSNGKIKKALPGMKRWQTALNEVYKPKVSVKVTGVWSEKTESVTAAFQKRKGLKITGKPNAETAAALGKNRFRVVA